MSLRLEFNLNIEINNLGKYIQAAYKKKLVPIGSWRFLKNPNRITIATCFEFSLMH